MPTASTTAVPYCPPERLFALVDWRAAADWAAGGAYRPSRASLLDPTDPAGAVLMRAVMAASGDLEAAVLRGKRYSVADLQSLTGASLAYREQVTAGLAVGVLAARRSPGAAKLDDVPGVRSAREAVKAQAAGEAVFGLLAQQAAGVGPTVVDTTPADLGFGERLTTQAARRFFGRRSRDTQRGW